MPLPLYPVSTLAKLFSLTERRVQQLAQEGIIPKAERGKYDLVGAVRGYLLFLQERTQTDVTTFDTADLQRERLRLVKAQADRAERENELLCRDLMPMREATAVLEEIAVLFVACLDTLPGRLAHELCGLDDPAAVKAKLFEACRGVRALTTERLQAWATQIKATDDCPLDCPSTESTDSGSVGG